MNLNDAFQLKGETASVLCADGETVSGFVMDVIDFEEDGPDSLLVEVTPTTIIEVPLDEIASYKILK